MTPFLRLPMIIPGASAITLDSTKVAPMFTAPTTTVPGQPTGLTAGAATPTTQVLNWIPPNSGGAVSDYLVERRKDGSGAWTGVLLGNANPTTIVSGLEAKSNYQYRVTAINAIGAGTPSTTITAQTADAFEAAAVGHWLLGGSAASLSGKGGSLTPVGTAPTYQAGYITIPGSSTAMTGLLSPFDDSLEQTMCAVFQYSPTTSNQMLMGALAAANIVGGDAFFHDTVYETNIRPGSGSRTAISMPVGLTSASQWFFVALSYTATGTVHRSFIGGNGNSVAATLTKAVASPMRKLALGNGHYTPSAFADPISCAEFIVFGSALDDAAMKAVYARSKARLAERGIVVF